jgi:hypothetical protein
MSTSTIRDAGAIGPGIARLNAEPPRKKDDDWQSARIERSLDYTSEARSGGIPGRGSQSTL